ncbi:hypothetical protein M3583_22465, partial [Bacillus subtilis]|nr:hypothetical protein [Bacillus subtilis]
MKGSLQQIDTPKRVDQIVGVRVSEYVQGFLVANRASHGRRGVVETMLRDDGELAEVAATAHDGRKRDETRK